MAKFTADGEELYEATASESDQRVEQLGLPHTGSENVSHLLVPPPNLPKRSLDEEPRDYRPADSVEWVVDIEFEGDPLLKQADVVRAFDRQWLADHREPTIFGWSPEIGHWTFLVSSDAPQTFTKLALGWRLYKSFEEDDDIRAADLERLLAATRRQAQRLGKPAIRVNRSPQEAEQAAERIQEAVEQLNLDVILVLVAPEGQPFEGRKVWDVMMCLGLRWGDGDLFHWLNDSGVGDDSFFSVQTSTPPGYFLPEDIAQGTSRFDDLAFGFSIPRSPDPVSTLDSLLKAVAYARQRLGGEIFHADGAPLDVPRLKRGLQQIVAQLKAAGFMPGEDATLYVF